MTQNILLAASYQWLNVSVGYSRVKDDMIQISENYSEENPTISLMKVVNTESYDRMTASLTVAPTIGLWKPQFTAELYKQWFSIETHNGIKSLNNPVGTFVWRNNLSLPAGILLDITPFTPPAATTRTYTCKKMRAMCRWLYTKHSSITG